MKSTWFTSDNHWGHKNILKFCPNTRLGDTVEQHDEILIENWNRDVKPGDDVYCLGDMFFSEPVRVREVLRRLNGNITLIYGNHDQVIKKNIDIQKMFVATHDYLELSMSKRTKVVLFHYPMMEWNKGHHGSYHLFGHVHGSMDTDPRVMKYRMMDVGIDGRPNGIQQQGGPMSLWHWDQIDTILKDRESFEHH
jgi:calcineurin-like phosphoesterase family protein